MIPSLKRAKARSYAKNALRGLLVDQADYVATADHYLAGLNAGILAGHKDVLDYLETAILFGPVKMHFDELRKRFLK